MDLDDSFTERLIQRSRARREFINEKKNEIFSVAKKRVALTEEHQVNSEDLSEESPKRQCTQTLQAQYSTHDKENVEIHDDDTNAEFVPFHSVSKARGLAALKRNVLNGEDEDSKVASELQEIAEASNKEVQENNFRQESQEEEYSDDESINEDDFAENYNDIKSDDGASKMDLDYSPMKQSKRQEEINETLKSEIFKKPKSPVLQESLSTSVDPAELPLSARKALFEKALLSGTPKINENVVDQKLSVAQRAAMFENASKVNNGTKTSFREPKRIAFSNFSKFEKTNNDCVPKSPVKITQSVTDSQGIKASPVKKMLEPVASTPSPTKSVGNHTRLIQQRLIESSGSNWQEKQAAKAAEERKLEICNLVNHWEKLSSASSIENSSEMSRNHLASEEIFSTESNNAQDISENEEESESDHVENEDDSNEVDTQNDNIDVNDYDDQKDEYYSDEQSDVAENVFYAQEAETESSKSMEGKYNSEHGTNVVSTSSHATRSVVSSLSYSGMSSYTDDSNYHASSSHSYSSGSSAGSYDLVSKVEDVVKKMAEEKEKNPEINLYRTVSTYRREKQETKLTPVRTVVRHEIVSSPESPPDIDYTEVIQKRLKELNEEIMHQQNIISQASNAISLCSVKPEFSGSTEHFEAERVLLHSVHKRQACINEISRLKTCGAQGENIADGTRTLTISDLRLRLKQEFVASLVQGKESDTVHYFVCLIRHRAQVIVTQLMSTNEKSSDGYLCFTNHIQLHNLAAGFSVVFEVYALQTEKKNLPHEKKYHIKRENSKKHLTPKGKKCDGKIPAISSPGGPNAVRSPSFGIIGFTRFTAKSCNKKTFTLDKVPFTSPLHGELQVQLKLHSEHKVILRGFLTFYEDVGGIGTLNRRWCVLDSSHIAYWKYPDDECRKDPVGLIDLRECITDVITLVPSIECMRTHTFKLVTMRPQKEGDKKTLISEIVNKQTMTKHLLTADDKDQRILWCNKINEALTNVREWNI